MVNSDIIYNISYLLPIQKLHEGPQHGVSVCLSGAVVGGAFHLVENLSHLTHAAVNASLETGGRDRGKLRGKRLLQRR